VQALRVEGLEVVFGGVRALGGVDLDVPAGSVHGVIGPNGAGKTTLFDAISGHLRPTSGTVRIEGEDVTNRSATWRARRGLRRTFQRQQVFGALTVAENLLAACEGDGLRGGVAVDLLGLAGRRRSAVTDVDTVGDMLERCHLSDVAGEPAGALPIGSARMVELARALVAGPSVLLLDEPTSGLGQQESELMASVLRDFLGSRPCGVVLVEHDVGFVMELCDRVTVLNLGERIAHGTPAAIQADPAVQAAYLG
jgi:branched-chain amino acid transport system ATP-binding protein